MEVYRGDLLDAARPKPNYWKRGFALLIAVFVIFLINNFISRDDTSGVSVVEVGRYSVVYSGLMPLQLPEGAAHDLEKIINDPRVLEVTWADYLGGGLCLVHRWSREWGFDSTLVGAAQK